MSGPSFQVYLHSNRRRFTYSAHGIILVLVLAHCMHKSKLRMLANFCALRRLAFVFRATPTHLIFVGTYGTYDVGVCDPTAVQTAFFPPKKTQGCTYITWPTHTSEYFGPGPFYWGPPSTTRLAFWSRRMGRPEFF